MVSIRAIFAIVVLVAAFALYSEAAYRKPPFNGSIFGKRANGITDYEVTNRAMTSMCEVANEACNAWFSRQETN